jgi:hypothetical protein
VTTIAVVWPPARWAGARSTLKAGRQSLEGRTVFFDIIVSLLITIVAVVLGITVHPLLFFIIVLAVLYFLLRSRSRR